jgi:hypothetical protein
VTSSGCTARCHLTVCRAHIRQWYELEVAPLDRRAGSGQQLVLFCSQRLNVRSKLQDGLQVLLAVQQLHLSLQQPRYI